MRRFPGQLLVWLAWIALPFLAAGYGSEIVNVAQRISPARSRWQMFLLGAVLFFPVRWLGRKLTPRLWHYLATLEHEWTHLLVGLLFGKRPVSFRASAYEGGEVVLRGGSNMWISLAPYFLPTLTFIALLAGRIFSLGSVSAFLITLGFTVSFHIISTWEETSFRQTDLRKVGLIRCCVFLPVANAIVYGSILGFIQGGYAGFANFWKAGLYNSLGSVGYLFSFIHQRL